MAQVVIIMMEKLIFKRYFGLWKHFSLVVKVSTPRSEVRFSDYAISCRLYDASFKGFHSNVGRAVRSGHLLRRVHVH